MAIGNTVAFADPARARTNIAAWNLINQVNGLNREIAIRQLRLATGKQQPRMEDGASFFVIWNKMKNQVRGKSMALDNIGDAKDELSLAEAGMLRIDEMLSRMRDLVVRAGNDTLTDEQRDDVRQELGNLYMAITEIVKRTRFNEGGHGEQPLLSGFHRTYQIGPNETELDKFQVWIPNLLAATAKALSPELGEPLSQFIKLIPRFPQEIRDNIAAEIKEFARPLSDGPVKDAVLSLAEAFNNPETIETIALGALTGLSQSQRQEFGDLLDELFDTRINPSAPDSPFKNFVNSEELHSAFNDVTPTIFELIGDPATLGAVADEIIRIADAASIQDEGVVKELKDVADAIVAVNGDFTQALDALNSFINNNLNTPTQRLFLGQDLAFYAASSPTVTGHTNVQNAIGQLALDVANGADGLPTFVEAARNLTNEEREILKTALSEVATDTTNGLAFHVAVPDLDGQGGPFSLSPGTFASAVVGLEERGQEILMPPHINMAAVFQGMGQNLGAQFPGIVNTLSIVIGLVSDGDDSNDAALGAAMNALGTQIELETGGNFFNPLARSRIRQAMESQVSTPAFAALPDSVKNAFQSIIGSLNFRSDLDGPGGPFSQSEGSLGKAVVDLIETNQPIVQQGPQDATSMVHLLQNVIAGMGNSFPNIAARINDVIAFLGDGTNVNDPELGQALGALGAQIEADAGTDSNVNGAARAELRRIILEQASSQAFSNLSLPLKAAYLGMAEAVGAYSVGQIVGLDVALEGFVNALSPDPNTINALSTELQELADEVSKPELSLEDRKAFRDAMAALAKSIAAIDPNNEKLKAIQNVIDDPTNDDDVNPDDLVGALDRYLTEDQFNVLKQLFTNEHGHGITDVLTNFLGVGSHHEAAALLEGIDGAIDILKDQLIHLGGIQTKLTGFENILLSSIETEDSVASRFGDADLAKEQVELSKLQLFSQLASAQAAAANVAPSQFIGSLLGGG